MSSFHLSGSCTLEINKQLKDFIKKHLVNIKNDKTDNSSILYFDTYIPNELHDIITKIPGYSNIIGNKIRFIDIEDVENEDVTKTINK